MMGEAASGKQGAEAARAAWGVFVGTVAGIFLKLAVSGPLTGRRLTPVAEAFVSFWFAWAAFYPDATLWSAP